MVRRICGGGGLRDIRAEHAGSPAAVRSRGPGSGSGHGLPRLPRLSEPRPGAGEHGAARLLRALPSRSPTMPLLLDRHPGPDLVDVRSLSAFEPRPAAGGDSSGRAPAGSVLLQLYRGRRQPDCIGRHPFPVAPEPSHHPTCAPFCGRGRPLRFSLAHLCQAVGTGANSRGRCFTAKAPLLSV